MIVVLYVLVISSQLLMKNMQLLMTSVDSLQQDTYRLLGYEKSLAKQQQAKQQFLLRRVSCEIVIITTVVVLIIIYLIRNF